MITKNLKNETQPDFAAGEVILIDKEEGLTSFRVVHKIRKAVQVKKVGHAGTLDPAATGLLIICTGKKTKEISQYQGMKKTYSGTITLGIRTDSMDREGEIIERNSIDGITEESILETVKLFIGNISQMPPMFSALKHKGKRLYKFARQGVEVERTPREVTIYNFVIKEIELPEISFEVECSKGTYIRVLADDIGNKLGCGAYLSKLRRDKIGEYSVNDALTVTNFEELYSFRNSENLTIENNK